MFGLREKSRKFCYALDVVKYKAPTPVNMWGRAEIGAIGAARVS